MSASFSRYSSALAVATAMLFLLPMLLEAQGKGRGRGGGNLPPPFQHDRGGFPPGPPPWQGGPPPWANGPNNGLLATPGGAAQVVDGAVASFTPQVQQTVRPQFDMGARPDASLVGALVANGNVKAEPQAEELVTELSGLTAEVRRLPSAVYAYNSFVRASSEEFLSEPPEEFLAIELALSSLVDEAWSAYYAQAEGSGAGTR